ncbi:MAG: bifunctional 4-hydroxy-2-oxoglutarate aldolase/2-dehydro-3-deoxy-phosphogluconate aldolase [Clostridia bacterium]|nr:bifunctional 4-hydroxy-2-oxoglutarate aldolase/2-dehydro-3-deoxy-phosphogluconate aldolase [Clostridia bacterium]
MNEALIEKILESKIVAIVRGVYGDDCLRLAEALMAGGVKLMEVTFDQNSPEKWLLTADAVSRLKTNFAGALGVGAGTVTSRELVGIAADAGAQFMISPDTNPEVIKETKKRGLVSTPGALTPTEILTAHNCGADFVKIFPAGSLGAGYIKAVRAPLNNVRLMAVGGVSSANAGEFIRAGACGVGVGGNLVDKMKIAAGLFEDITEEARRLCESVKEA